MNGRLQNHGFSPTTRMHASGRSQLDSSKLRKILDGTVQAADLTRAKQLLFARRELDAEWREFFSEQLWRNLLRYMTSADMMFLQRLAATDHPNDAAIAAAVIASKT